MIISIIIKILANLMSYMRAFQIKQSLLTLTVISLAATTQVFAQVDAGALQQGLEKQLPLPSPWHCRLLLRKIPLDLVLQLQAM